MNNRSFVVRETRTLLAQLHAFVLALLMFASVAQARAVVAPFHPMPNTVIALSIEDAAITMDIAVPLPELKLAMQGDWPPKSRALDDASRAAIVAYCKRHVVVRSSDNVVRPWEVQNVTVWESVDENVGSYQELRLRLRVDARANPFDTRHFALAYDAVIHQIPNHFALVEIIQDFSAGILETDKAVDIGVIRFDFATNTTPVLAVNAGDGSWSTGFRNIVAIGFRHVMLGYDHILFLLTLLIVAPLRAANGKWSLFQGWSYAAKRFLGISLAFTLGHSVALLIGAYEIVHVRASIVETLIAISIVVTAIHAIRPIFPEREWIVAAAFGTVHGLAFAEGIAGLVMSPGLRALTVGGFNVGIEAAQLVAMFCAIPLLLASRWRVYHVIRISVMTCAIVLAARWGVERARTIPPAVAAVGDQAAVLAVTRQY